MTLSPALTLDEVGPEEKSAASAEAPRGSDFTPLMAAMRGSGLLRLRRRHYAATITADLVAFFAVWTAVVLVGATWWVLFLAVPAAIFTTRLIFIGHDVGHSQIARTRTVNHVMGLVVGDVIVGLSARWWVDKHSRHHANPNQVGRDPDVNDAALVWNEEQAAARTGQVAIWFAKHQAYMYVPMLLLQALNLKVGTIKSIRRAASPRDAALLTLHVLAYGGVLLLALGPARAAVFFLIHQAVLGLHLGCAFAPNHKGMAMPPEGSRWDFFRKQVLTSRNVSGGRVVDWFLGGLNYQIEHHLFPSMPRPNLRFAQGLVRAHCVKLGVPYVEASLRASMVLTVRHLHAVGAARRA